MCSTTDKDQTACSIPKPFLIHLWDCVKVSPSFSLVEMGHDEAGLSGRDLGWGKCGRDRVKPLAWGMIRVLVKTVREQTHRRHDFLLYY